MGKDKLLEWDRPPKNQKEPSLTVVDPWARIMAAVVARAFDDLVRGDPLVQLDALIWLLYGDAWMFLDALGIDVTQ